MKGWHRLGTACLALLLLLPAALAQPQRTIEAGADELNARGLHVLSYHPFPDPQGDTWGYPERENNGSRVGYMEGAYGAYWYPTTVLDGVDRVDGATAFQTTYNAYNELYLQRRIQDSPLRIFLLGKIDGDAINVTTQIHAKAPIVSARTDLRIVLFEDEVHFDGGNGVTVHRFVPRATLHDGTVDLNAGDLDLKVTSPLDPAWDRARLGIVASVHNHDRSSTQYRDAEVLQSTSWRAGQLGPTIQVRRGVLLETLSATWCAACIFGDGAVDELANEYGLPSSKALGGDWTYLRTPQWRPIEFATGTWETGLLVAALLGFLAALFFDVAPSRRAEAREALVRRLLYGSVGALVVALVLLAFYFLVTHLAIEYVFSYTRAGYPWYYRVAGLWAGQKGTVLMWAAFLGIASIAFLRKSERAIRDGAVPADARDLLRVSRRVLLTILALFALATLVARTFSPTPDYLLRFRPLGNGLQPVLITPFMVIHPPLQFVSYALTSLAFAAGAAHIVTGHNGWVALVRPWARLNWLLATIGLGLGGLWAYYVLNFGGYWAWDPVETANLIAWFPLTLLLHALLRAREGAFRATAPLFALLAMPAALFSTVATRTGLWVSVHAFTDPTKNFARDPLVRLLNILETGELLRYLTALFLLTGIIALHALVLGRTRDWPEARRRRARTMATVVAGAVGAFTVLDVVATLGAGVQLAHAITLGRSAALGLLLLGFGLAALVLLTGPEEATRPAPPAAAGWRKWATTSHLLTAGVALLGLSFLIVLLLDLLSVNGYDRAVYDERAPYVALPILLVLAAHFLVALRGPGLAALLVVGAAITGGALAVATSTPYFLVLPALLLVAAASLARFVRTAGAGAQVGRRDRVVGLLLVGGALASLLLWANPPTRIALAGYVARPEWWWAGPAYALALFALLAGAVCLARPRPGLARVAALALVPTFGVAWLASLAGLAVLIMARGPRPKTSFTAALRERRSSVRKASVFLLHFALAVGLTGYVFSTYAAVQTEAFPVTAQGSMAVRGYSFQILDGLFAAGVDADQGIPKEIHTRIQVLKDGTPIEDATIVHWLVPDDTAGHYDARVTVVRLAAEDLYLYPTSVVTQGGEIHDHINGARPTDPAPISLEMTLKVLPAVGLVWAGLWLLTIAMAAQLLLGGFAVAAATATARGERVAATADTGAASPR